MTDSLFEPKLRVAASGLGGSGYMIPTRPLENGKPSRVIGVTTALGVLDKSGVTQWAVDNTAAFAVANVDALLNRSEEQGYGFLRWYHKRMKESDFDDPTVDIRDYSNGVLNDLAELGTTTGDWISAHMNGMFEPDLYRDEQVQMVEAFLNWKADHDIEVLATEATVVGGDHAGTLDEIWVIDGVPMLIDTKTTRHIRGTHYAQLAALGAAEAMLTEVGPGEGVEYETKKWGKTYWREDPLPAFSEYAILHLRPNDTDTQGNFVPAFCELKPVSHEKIDAGWALFRATVDARLALKAIKDLEKPG